MFSRFSLIPGRGCGEARVQPSQFVAREFRPFRSSASAQPLLSVTPNATSYLDSRRVQLCTSCVIINIQYRILLEIFSN